MPQRQASDTRTKLDWPSFDWKPDPKSFLRGIDNYSIYRETILLQLECIGFRTGLKLKPAAVIQRTVTPEISEMISGISGTEIMRLFESTFRRAWIMQVEV